MDKSLNSKRLFCILSGLSGVAGVVLLMLSFTINGGPPPGATGAELVKFGQQNYANILWGAWLQAVGPVLIVLFAFALVHLAGATQRFVGWMTLFGATTLMTVSLIEITFYISALSPNPEIMPSISLKLISAVQHLYFIVAAPSSVPTAGHCSCRLPDTPTALWIFSASISNRLCRLGGCFSPRFDASRGSYGICWSPGALVVGRCHHAHHSLRKNSE